MLSGCTTAQIPEADPGPDTTSSSPSGSASQSTHDGNGDSNDLANLALPIRAEDLGDSGGFISPFGIVRHSRDRGYGHGGIDAPLDRGDPIFAVADGTILTNESAQDDGGGYIVDVLIGGPRSEGEVGWIFKYEHVALNPGLAKDSLVRKGQQIGTSDNGGENHHLSLEYVFNELGYTRDHTCWVERLEADAGAELRAAFDAIRATSSFRAHWHDAQEEGHYNYRGLLDEARFPEGPQLCYPLGTDARVPIESGTGGRFKPSWDWSSPLHDAPSE